MFKRFYIMNSEVPEFSFCIYQSREDGIVVFSGCGTSGRLGFIVAVRFTSLSVLTHSHTMTPFDAPGKQAF